MTGCHRYLALSSARHSFSRAGIPDEKTRPNRERVRVKGAPMSETFYTSCADVLALFQAQKDDLEALLDPQAGFAPRLRQLCEQQCVPSSNTASFFFFPLLVSYITYSRLADIREEGNATPEEMEALRMECSTWALLQAIMPCVQLTVLSPTQPNKPDPSTTTTHHPTNPNNSSLFLYLAHEKPNPHSNHQPALSSPRILTPQPQLSPKQQWQLPARYQNSSSCASGCMIRRPRRRVRTRRRGIGALRSIA